jgi:hypothetical protein
LREAKRRSNLGCDYLRSPRLMPRDDILFDLIKHEWQQAQMARTLESGCKLSLMFGTSSGASARFYLHVTRKIATESFSIFVIDVLFTLVTKRTNFFLSDQSVASAKSYTTSWAVSSRHKFISSNF